VRGGRIPGRVGLAASLTEMGVATRGAQLGEKLRITGEYISQNRSYLDSHPNSQGVFPQLRHGIQVRPEDHVHGRLRCTCSRVVFMCLKENHTVCPLEVYVYIRMSRSLRRTFQV